MQLLVDILRSDIVSRTAASVVTANPSKFPDASYVNQSDYLCLRDILFPGADPAAPGYADLLNNAIVSTNGLDASLPDISINVYEIPADQSRAVKSSSKSNVSGAETAELAIHIKINKQKAPHLPPKTSTDCEARIRWLLDADILSTVRRVGPNLVYTYEDVAAACTDHSIYHWITDQVEKKQQNVVMAKWQRYLKPPLAYEVVSVYTVDYVRVFSK